MSKPRKPRKPRKPSLDRRVLSTHQEGAREYAYVNIADLRVPGFEGGQRVLKEPMVEKIVANFEEARLLTIVIWRRDDGTLWIIDGQHRVEALRRLGHSVVFADIRSGITEEQAAYLFWHLNDDPVRVGEFDKFLARIKSGDPVAISIQNVVVERGFHLDRHGRAIHGIAAVRAVETVHERGGSALIADVLTAISQTWRVDPKALTAPILTGVGTFLDTWQDAAGYDTGLRGGPLDPVRLLDTMAAAPATEIEQRQRAYAAEYGHTGHSESRIAIVLRDLYNNGRRIRRLKGAPKGRSGRRGGGWVKNTWGKKPVAP